MKIPPFKPLLLATALALGAAGTQAQPQTNAVPTPPPQKIATIDLRKTFDGYYKTRQADGGLKDEANEVEKQRKDMVDSFRKNEDDYKKLIEKTSDQSISTDEREKAKQAAQKKFTELQEQETAVKQFLESNRAKLAEKQRRLREKILGEIQEVVNLKAKAGGYAFVLDTAAETVNNTKVIVFTTGEDDLTEAILAQLNAAAPADFGKDDKKPEPTAKPIVPDLNKK